MDATLIYPHQLFLHHPGLAPGRPVFIIEEPLFLTEFPTHRQKLLLHRLSIVAYAKRLTKAGYQVTILELKPNSTTSDMLTAIAKQGYTTWHICDTTDDWLEQRITSASVELGTKRILYESLLFILPKGEAVARYQASGRKLARFYQSLRRDLHILLEKDGSPTGGKWSFDDENRQKLPKNHPLLPEPTPYLNTEVKAALTWLKDVSGEQYGEANVWLPYTHEAAETWLHDFIAERLSQFGPYEDALTTRGHRLFHSVLSPLLNIGLLTPQAVLDATLTYAKQHNTPLASLEGFIRQILGWREFIRASYEADGRIMRTKNFWQHSRPLPTGLWTATTGLLPLDQTINGALTWGYNHHIERLMVLGNYLLLTETNPDEVYRWFMAMYVDAYDWVMVPNIYGMSQFADGGLFATKPYISGSNYLRKMSDYPKGEWEPVWDGLYWRFIETHKDIFKQNYRLKMMPHLLQNMAPEKRQQHFLVAKDHLAKAHLAKIGG